MTLRLTLRTLLSYLDDTLEPSQAKILGTKAAEIEPDQEEAARLGVPVVKKRQRVDARNFWLLVGGGVLAACVLVIAVWQLVRGLNSGGGDRGDAPIAELKETPSTPPAKSATTTP